MNIGLVAHDAKKKLMQNFCIAYRGILSKHNLYATETTGILVENVTNRMVMTLLSFVIFITFRLQQISQLLKH